MLAGGPGEGRTHWQLTARSIAYSPINSPLTHELRLRDDTILSCLAARVFQHRSFAIKAFHRNQREDIMIKAVTGILLLLAAAVALSGLLGAGAPAQAAAVAHCMEAWECHGPLPQICVRCRDGHSECAHWACVRHKCVVETCPGVK